MGRSLHAGISPAHIMCTAAHAHTATQGRALTRHVAPSLGRTRARWCSGRQGARQIEMVRRCMMPSGCRPVRVEPSMHGPRVFIMQNRPALVAAMGVQAQCQARPCQRQLQLGRRAATHGVAACLPALKTALRGPLQPPLTTASRWADDFFACGVQAAKLCIVHGNTLQIPSLCAQDNFAHHSAAHLGRRISAGARSPRAGASPLVPLGPAGGAAKRRSSIQGGGWSPRYELKQRRSVETPVAIGGMAVLTAAYSPSSTLGAPGSGSHMAAAGGATTGTFIPAMWSPSRPISPSGGHTFADSPLRRSSRSATGAPQQSANGTLMVPWSPRNTSSPVPDSAASTAILRRSMNLVDLDLSLSPRPVSPSGGGGGSSSPHHGPGANLRGAAVAASLASSSLDGPSAITITPTGMHTSSPASTPLPPEPIQEDSHESRSASSATGDNGGVRAAAAAAVNDNDDDQLAYAHARSVCQILRTYGPADGSTSGGGGRRTLETEDHVSSSRQPLSPIAASPRTSPAAPAAAAAAAAAVAGALHTSAAAASARRMSASNHYLHGSQAAAAGSKPTSGGGKDDKAGSARARALQYAQQLAERRRGGRPSSANGGADSPLASPGGPRITAQSPLPSPHGHKTSAAPTAATSKRASSTTGNLHLGPTTTASRASRASAHNVPLSSTGTHVSGTASSATTTAPGAGKRPTTATTGSRQLNGVGATSAGTSRLVAGKVPPPGGAAARSGVAVAAVATRPLSQQAPRPSNAGSTSSMTGSVGDPVDAHTGVGGLVASSVKASSAGVKPGTAMSKGATARRGETTGPTSQRSKVTALR